MATAKKKTAAKRATKYAAKAQSKAAHTTASIAKSAAHQNAAWAKKGASEWQKGASEWAKQSAKLYQLPFASGDVNEATKQATAAAKTATENMMKASTDIMQQMFGGTDPMAQWGEMFTKAPKLAGAEQAAGKLRDMSRESAQQFSKITNTTQHAAQEAAELSRENAQVLVEVGNIAISVSKEIGAELISYANKSFSTNVELGKQMMSCRTLNDLFDLSSKIAKTNLDAFFSESVKLSEKLFQCGTDISEPLNERVSATSDRLSKALSA